MVANRGTTLRGQGSRWCVAARQATTDRYGPGTCRSPPLRSRPGDRRRPTSSDPRRTPRLSSKTPLAHDLPHLAQSSRQPWRRLRPRRANQAHVCGRAAALPTRSGPCRMMTSQARSNVTIPKVSRHCARVRRAGTAAPQAAGFWPRAAHRGQNPAETTRICAYPHERTRRASRLRSSVFRTLP